VDDLYVLVGGWPGSGRSTLALGLAAALGLPLLAKDELWGRSVRPLGVGPLVEVDTSGPVDVPALAARLRAS
jgi:hypothetical protein